MYWDVSKRWTVRNIGLHFILLATVFSNIASYKYLLMYVGFILVIYVGRNLVISLTLYLVPSMYQQQLLAMLLKLIFIVC